MDVYIRPWHSKVLSGKFIPPCPESSSLISFQISPAYPRLNFATKIYNPICNIWRFYSPQEKRNLTSGRGKFVYELLHQFLKQLKI